MAINTVNPGDWVFGDDDGVVSFSEKDRSTLITAAAAKYHAEQARLTAIDKGKLSPDWLHNELANAEISIGTRHW